MAQSPENNLGLSGDDDEIYFVEEIESAFGIRFQHEELEKCRTMGDIYDALCRHLQLVERGPFPCLSASAFRQVRKVIAETRTGAPIRPDTRITDLVGDERVEKWWDALQRRCDLKLPPVPASGWQILLVLTAIGLVVLAAVLLPILGLTGQPDSAGLLLWSLFGLAALFVAAAVWLPFGRSIQYETVGDLARAAGVLNVGTLSQLHGAIRAREAWSSLVWIARDYTGHDGPVDRETALIG
jgi:hypothetical protein